VAPSLGGTVAIVTGAGRGIGRAIALAYAKEGAAVGIAARTRAEIDAVAAAIIGAGGRALPAVIDVTNAPAVNGFVSSVVGTFGQIDVLVNNAGVPGPMGLLHDTDDSEWRRTLDVNVTGIFLCCKAVLPHMIARRRGNIINVSSGAGLKHARAKVRSLAYQVSKFGVEGLTAGLAVQMRAYDINVNSLLPGPIATAFHDRTPPELLAGALGRPEDVVPAVLRLASLAPGEMTGQTVHARDYR
jgi:3-oxoacyl-[acyl-carrier protein] reductase